MLLDVLMAGVIAVLGSLGLAQLGADVSALNRATLEHAVADNLLADLDAQWRFAGIASGTAPAPGAAGCHGPELADWCVALNSSTTLPGPSRLCSGAGTEPGWTLVWRGGSCAAAGEHQRSRRFVW